MPRWFAVLTRGGSNAYPQSMFWSKNKKNRYTPTTAYPSFAVYKSGVQRGIHYTVFVMVYKTGSSRRHSAIHFHAEMELCTKCWSAS